VHVNEQVEEVRRGGCFSFITEAACRCIQSRSVVGRILFWEPHLEYCCVG